MTTPVIQHNKAIIEGNAMIEGSPIREGKAIIQGGTPTPPPPSGDSWLWSDGITDIVWANGSTQMLLEG